MYLPHEHYVSDCMCIHRESCLNSHSYRKQKVSAFTMLSLNVLLFYRVLGIVYERRLSRYVNCHSVCEKMFTNLVIQLCIIF